MKQLVFATNNKNKLREMREIMEGLYEVLSLEDIGCREEIVEDADTIEGNARIKADFVTSRYHVDCFADDTGLEIDALDGRPGVYSARYAGEGCSFADNVRKVLAELQDVRDLEKRSARFRTVVALILDGREYFFEGKVEGYITLSPSGNEGFGYDPVFLPKGWNQTFAEMDAADKNRISHRGRAIAELVGFLNRSL